MEAGPPASDGGLRTRGGSGLKVVVEIGVVGGSRGGVGRLSTPEQPSRTPASQHFTVFPFYELL